MQTIRPTATRATRAPSTRSAPKVDHTRGALEELAVAEARIKRQRATLRTPQARAIYAAVHAIEPWINTSFWSDEIVVYVSLSGLDTFADPKLAAAITALDAAFGHGADKYEHNENAYQEARDWVHAWPDTVDVVLGHTVKSPLLPIRVHLAAYEKEEGAACRRIQVGTRTEQVPVYKMVCSDTGANGAPAELPAPVLALDL